MFPERCSQEHLAQYRNEIISIVSPHVWWTWSQPPSLAAHAVDISRLFPSQHPERLFATRTSMYLIQPTYVGLTFHAKMWFALHGGTIYIFTIYIYEKKQDITTIKEQVKTKQPPLLHETCLLLHTCNSTRRWGGHNATARSVRSRSTHLNPCAAREVVSFQLATLRSSQDEAKDNTPSSSTVRLR